jgi:exopolysaccharide biosynthesis polyprenyl glycosylphosphotransferase
MSRRHAGLSDPAPSVPGGVNRVVSATSGLPQSSPALERPAAAPVWVWQPDTGTGRGFDGCGPAPAALGSAPIRRDAPSIPRAPAPRILVALLDRRRWSAVRAACDLLMLVISGAIAVLVSPSGMADLPLLVYPPLTLVLLCSRGRYRRRLRDNALDYVAPGIGAISIGAMGAFMLSLLTVGNSQTATALIAHTWLASLVLVSSAGAILTLVETGARLRGIVVHPTLIVGADAAGCEFAGRLRRHREYGLEPVGFLDPSPVSSAPDGMPPVLGTLENLADVATLHAIRHVIVGFPAVADADVQRLVGRCDELGLDITMMPRLASTINRRAQLEYLGAMPVLNLRATDLGSIGFGFKYLLDRVAATLLLVILAPLMFAIALAVWLSSPGPILYRQVRTGQDGELFELLKFRTMLATPPGEFVAPDDALAPGGIEGTDRRTRVGRLLRRTSLDELPQLINVLRQSMSLIGPRPERPEFADEFRRRFARYGDRQRVRSGITGWAQVHGSRGHTPIADRVELDNFYIEHWSLGLDAKILVKTLPALFRDVHDA